LAEAAALASAASAASAIGTATSALQMSTETAVGLMETDLSLAVAEAELLELQAKVSNLVCIPGISSNLISPSIVIGDPGNFGDVTINGFVRFPLMQNWFGMNTNNGFVSQF